MRIDELREGDCLSLVLYKERMAVGCCRLLLAPGRTRLEELFIHKDWRGRGYGSYLLRQALHATGGFGTSSLHVAPPPASEAAAALLKKFGFAPAGDIWLRRRISGFAPCRRGLFHRRHLRQRQRHGLSVPAGGACGKGAGAGRAGKGGERHPRPAGRRGLCLRRPGGAGGPRPAGGVCRAGQRRLRGVQLWVSAGGGPRPVHHPGQQPARPFGGAGYLKAGRNSGGLPLQRRAQRP